MRGRFAHEINTGRYIYTKFVQGIALGTSVTLTKERLCLYPIYIYCVLEGL